MSEPETSASESPSPSRGRLRFRVTLADLFGLLTLSAIAIWAVLLVPEKDHEDRFYVQAVSISLLLAIAVARGFGKRGIVAAGLGAAFGSATAMSLFLTPLWTTWHGDEVNSTLTVFPWWMVVVGTFLTGAIGVAIGGLYCVALRGIQLGPRAIAQKVRNRPVLASILAAAVVLPMTALWTVDRLYWGGGPRPRIRIGELDETLPFIDKIIGSPTGKVWLLEVIGDPETEQAETDASIEFAEPMSLRYWRVFHVDGDKLRKGNRFATVGGPPEFSPDGRHLAYFDGALQLVVADIETGNIVAKLSFTEKPICHDLRWLPGGKIVFYEVDDQIDWISAWSFDGSQLFRQSRIQTIRDFPVAIGPDFEWLLQIVHGEIVVTRVADEQEISQVAMRFRQDRALETDIRLSFRELKYLVSPEARWISDGDAIFDLKSGNQIRFPYDQLFGFTPDGLAIVSRRPYASTSNQEGENAGLGIIENNLATVPVWRYLSQIRDQEQLAFIDLATGELIAKLGSVGGYFLEASTSRNGRTIGAIFHTNPRTYEWRCGFGSGGSVSTTRSFVIWDVPARDR